MSDEPRYLFPDGTVSAVVMPHDDGGWAWVAILTRPYCGIHRLAACAEAAGFHTRDEAHDHLIDYLEGRKWTQQMIVHLRDSAPAPDLNLFQME